MLAARLDEVVRLGRLALAPAPVWVPAWVLLELRQQGQVLGRVPVPVLQEQEQEQGCR